MITVLGFANAVQQANIHAWTNNRNNPKPKKRRVTRKKRTTVDSPTLRYIPKPLRKEVTNGK